MTQNKICLHCQNNLEENQVEFCCLGCAAAYKIIGGLGFENYYKLREVNPSERKIKPELAEEIDVAEFIVNEKDGSYSLSLMVQGLHCAACVWLIESILKKQKDVIAARINLSKKVLFLRWKDDLGNPQESGKKLIHLIFEIGYKLLPFDEEVLQASEKEYDDSILRALAVAGFGVGNIMLFSIGLWFSTASEMGVATRTLLHFFSSLIALPVIIFSSRPFFKSAFRSIKSGYPNMDLAISIAIFLACVVSLLETFRNANNVYFDSAVMLVFFLLIGRYLDLKARKKAFAVATEFGLLAASFGRVEEDRRIKTLPSKKLLEGMILLVAAGEKIAADGVVIEGESEIDNSLISGESLPQKISLGQQAFAGMINLAAPLKIKITKTAQNSLLSEIIHITESVESRKNHYIRIADRLAKFYTPAVHALALITFLFWNFWQKAGWEISLMNATAVLIITCPCALALAVPIVQTILISNFTRRGILIKSGEAMEKLREAEVIIFDKTGSITLGKPRLCEVLKLTPNGEILLSKKERDFYLLLAASLAKKSRHPLSVALCESCDGNFHELSVEENQGLGLSATFGDKLIKLGRKSFCEITSSYLAKRSKAEDLVRLDSVFKAQETLGAAGINDDEYGSTKDSKRNQPTCFMKFGEEELVFVFEDELKEDADSTITRLQEMNKRVILLSGDNEKIVTNVAKKLGISEFYFEETPVSKVRILEEIKAKNQKIVMVGDGINDAPSLALADISISFSQASDISQNVADIVIQGQKLWPIIDLINSSKRSILLMKQNLLLALLYNLIAVPFAMLGHVVPLVAAIAMSSSSLIVLGNSLRMRLIQK